MKVLHDNDADLSVLNGKTVAMIGYGNQGSAQALCMRDSGVNVIIGSIKDVESGKFARKWLKESRQGCPNLLAKRKVLGDHPIEVTGCKFRKMFERK